MKRVFILGPITLILLLSRPAPAADAVYINNGTITFPPQIDATNFINNGTFDFSSNPTTDPFETSDTLNFTNNGTMFGSVGFQFDNAPSTSGIRRPAANFHNRLAGTITAPDVISFIGTVAPSYLLASATNIINEGTLIAGSGGLMRLQGDNVNLSRSGIEIAPVSAL